MAAMDSSARSRSFSNMPEQRRRVSGPLRLARRMLMAIAFITSLYQLKLGASRQEGIQEFPSTTCETGYVRTLQAKQKRTEAAYAEPSRLYTIFYNIYIPTEPRNATDRAIEIVKEQLDQIHESDLAKLNQPVMLYYTTVGKADVLNATSMGKNCSERDLICHHISHHDSGNEDIILQKVYEYCVDQTNDIKIVYLHTKGSYNEREGMNHRWRRHMTRAVTNKLCLEPANDACDVCGLQYWPLFASIFPGNMWVGKCSHIRKLIPPVDFGQKQQVVADKVKSLVKEKKMSSALIPIQVDYLGLERWAPEHWIASHPELVPCDLSKSLGLAQCTKYQTPLKFQWKMAPRAPLSARWTFPRPKKKRQLLPDANLHMREHWLLPGRLLRWVQLFNATPPASSWVWSWFPDGDIWREAIEKHGTAAVEVMLELNASRSEQGVSTSKVDV